MHEDAITALYFELANMPVGSCLDRNSLFGSLGIGRRRACREVVEIFREDTECPLARLIQSRGIAVETDPESGRAYFIRK